MKAIIIGSSLSGKTTLIRYLRSKTDLPLLEVDEELVRINHGQYPTDNDHKHKVLIPEIIKDILNRDDIIFFTNTDYFGLEDLKKACKNGFQIIQLSLDLIELKKRNQFRVKNEGYPDVNQWLEGMIKYQTEMREKSLVDKVINANQPIENIASELIAYLKN